MKSKCSCFSPQKRTIEPEQTADPGRHNLCGGFLSLLFKDCALPLFATQTRRTLRAVLQLNSWCAEHLLNN
jgi:hypothetical protein